MEVSVAVDYLAWVRELLQTPGVRSAEIKSGGIAGHTVARFDAGRPVPDGTPLPPTCSLFIEGAFPIGLDKVGPDYKPTCFDPQRLGDILCKIREIAALRPLAFRAMAHDHRISSSHHLRDGATWVRMDLDGTIQIVPKPDAD